MNSFRMSEDLTFANDFLRLFDTPFKKRKKSFLKSEKNEKYVFSNTASQNAVKHENDATYKGVMIGCCSTSSMTSNNAADDDDDFDDFLLTAVGRTPAMISISRPSSFNTQSHASPYSYLRHASSQLHSQLRHIMYTFTLHMGAYYGD